MFNRVSAAGDDFQSVVCAICVRAEARPRVYAVGTAEQAAEKLYRSVVRVERTFRSASKPLYRCLESASADGNEFFNKLGNPCPDTKQWRNRCRIPVQRTTL